MSTGSIECRRKARAARPLAKFGLWIAAAWQRLGWPAGTMHEDDMPDWVRRDIGWDDGPAEQPRAVVEGWNRPPARRPTRSQ